MGFLGSLFKKDWSAELSKIEAALDQGLTVEAYDWARRAVKNTEGDLRVRAESLLQTVREEWVNSALQKADRAELEGDYSDAADWIKSAIEKCGNPSQVTVLEERRSQLQNRILDSATPFVQAAREAGAVVVPETMDLDFHFEMLTNTLNESLRQQFLAKGSEFRQAVIYLNEGQAEEAVDILDDLLRDQPDDGILRLERGRALLILLRTEEARRDFEAAWDEVGESTLDETGSLSLPALWAEAALGHEDYDSVIARLEDLASPRSGRTDLFQLYAGSLVATKRYEQAEPYLNEVLQYQGNASDLVLLQAGVLASTDRLDQAIEGLEASIAPSCAGGSCGRKAKHLPSFRTLAEFYLTQGQNLDRCRELMAMVAHRQGGAMGPRDHQIMGRYYEMTGDLEAAEHCRLEAERLAGRMEVEAIDSPSAGRGAVL